MKKVILILGLSFFMIGGLSAQETEYEYIGAIKCKMCHNKPTKGEQYNKWLEGPHANAYNVLNDAAKNDDNCLSCHTTPDLDPEEGVSCESCHGPGSDYKSSSVMRDREESIENGLTLPTEEVCKKCHNEKSPNFKGFNFEEYYEKIKH